MTTIPQFVGLWEYFSTTFMLRSPEFVGINLCLCRIGTNFKELPVSLPYVTSAMLAVTLFQVCFSLRQNTSAVKTELA